MQPESDDPATFWQWFADNGERIFTSLIGKDDQAREIASEEMTAALASVAEGVTFVFGNKPDGVREFVLSADGKTQFADAVKELAASAPELPGWTVVAFRPRMAIAESLVLRIRDEDVGPDDVWFAVQEAEDGLALTFHVRGLLPDNEELRAMGAMLLMDHALGELDVMMLVDSFETEPLSSDPKAEGLHPFRDLVGVVDTYKAGRFPPPGQIQIGKAEWIGMEGEIGESPAFITLHGGLRRVAGHPAYDHVLIVSVLFNSTNEAGFPEDREEMIEVQNVGNQIAAVLQEGQQALLALVVVNRGRRDLIFYTSDPEGTLERLEKATEEITTHEVEEHLRVDTFWGMYRSFLHAASEE